MSTRKQRRRSVGAQILTAYPGKQVFADPYASLLQNESASALTFALSRGVRSADPSAEMGAVHQEKHELWEIYFLIPGHDLVATEDLADDVFEALQAALAPAAGFKPAGDAAPLELRDEDVWTREAKVGTIYYAIYANEFWEG
jgi:hypothetical protein